MCGLAGIIAWDERTSVSRQTLEGMSARIAHRGPDGAGLWMGQAGSGPRAGLAHRRLAVIDLDPRADQPLTDGRGRWIVFNGEIYNYRELRRELEGSRPDYAWKTECDTEVLLLAYDVWGTECVEHLNGMFAFAVWDGPAGDVFLARDRMGQKPLYYAVIAGAIAFASELGALMRVPWVDAAMDQRALGEYLAWGYVPSPKTIYAGAAKLPPGHWMKVSGTGTQIRQYFDPNVTGLKEEADAQSNAAARPRELVLQAVRRRLVSDVPLGCFLSGGIDSSIIAACMRQAVGSDQRLLTFSIGFEDPRYDETAYAAAVARHFKTEHQQFTVRPDAAGDLPALAKVFGEPFGDSSALPTYYLSRQTRQEVKVALSGDGGDELFGGYDRYRAMALSERVRGMPGFVRDGIVRVLPAGNVKSRKARLRRFVESLGEEPARRYGGYMRLFSEQQLVGLLKDNAAMNNVSREDWLARPYQKFLDQGRDVVQAALALDRVTYLPEDLLTKVDRASMLHALEVRSPFMDHELVGFASTLSTPQLIKGGGKRMLREAFKNDLPAEVFGRKKMGFAVPIGEWFRGEMRGLLRETLLARSAFSADHFSQAAVEGMIQEHQQRKVDHSQRLYALLMLELWWRQRGD